MRAENFIYFSIVSGFFIGLIFSILNDFGILDLIFATIIITLLFYVIALAGVSFFIKFYDIKKRLFLDVKEIEEVIDVQIKEMENYENFIFESYKFIEQVEQEELDLLRKTK